MEQQEKSDHSTKKPGTGTVWLAVVVIGAISIFVTFIVVASLHVLINHAPDAGAKVTDKVERVRIPVESYLQRDGESVILIKSTSGGLLVFRNKDGDDRFDHVSAATFIEGELHEWSDGRKLSEHDPIRQKTLQEYKDSLKIY